MQVFDSAEGRADVDGKFFRLCGKKFYLKGVTYGPFAPNDRGEFFASPAQTTNDFQQHRELGANLLRVYYVPPRWVLDLALEHGLKLLIDIPWEKHRCFLEEPASQKHARETVRRAVTDCRAHPAVFAYSVVNEIPAEIVRWSGVRRVECFIDLLVEEAKGIDDKALCTFASFPPTEFLRPQGIDFCSFNVYLHQLASFEAYLARLQSLVGDKPLVLGEFGFDSKREGEGLKCELLASQTEAAFRAGAAGTIVFSFTDDWFRSGRQIEDWEFGLTTHARQPKESFRTVQKAYAVAPYFPLPRFPKVSVIVASYNGARTLKACLDSLARLNYPEYEVILVDDGSTDNTLEIASLYPQVRYLRQGNQGLSVARNTGVGAASGEIIAFTDSDCRADDDWLRYLVGDLLRGDYKGIGGHNFLPPEDSSVAAAVLVSPGGPAHVMLTDREAEHVPGCNMGFYKWALDDIRGFDPVFRKAGDDVDVCWRFQERGHKIGFSPAGFVWHYRRSTVKAYLKQQNGYGEAEALLLQKHPEYFSAFGGGIWHGRIYSASKFGVTLSRPMVYHGLFGSGFFQKLYTPAPSFALMFCTSLEYHLLINLPLLALSISFHKLAPVALVSVLTSFGVCVVACIQAELPKKKRKFWSRPLVAVLFFLQPVVRGWARYRWRWDIRARPQPRSGAADSDDRIHQSQLVETSCYWSNEGADRYTFLNRILSGLDLGGWQSKWDSGWSAHDVEVFGSRWSRVRLTTVAEELSHNKRFLRCRFKATWSLPALFAFWLLLFGELLLISLFASLEPWLWMILLGTPLLGWCLEDEKQHQQQSVALLVDEIAGQLNLQKYEFKEKN
ncbi:MAG TPA: glycosyltransferase [Candidatus Angelobacter sp.]|nr:glycosyltransferase [Candidatus Angelobacter sp.]